MQGDRLLKSFIYLAIILLFAQLYANSVSKSLRNHGIQSIFLDSFYILVSGLMTVNTNMNKTLFVFWAHLVVEKPDR